MTDIIMDICDTASNGDFCLPVKCALDVEPPNARRISTESDLVSIDLPSRRFVTNSCSDFSDDYDIFPTILGTGGYGCVRECLHRSTGEKFAVKTIEKSMVDSLDHIRQEIQILRSVDHPGIMKMIDCYEDDNFVHIVTEKYTGGELFDKIIDSTSERGCLPEDEAVRIIKSLLESVQYLHSKDIVHRDIKPENILFETNEDGSSLKLIDFGLSRTHGAQDSFMTENVGTLYYMSPDVLRGRYDRSCDLWAIGVVSYILLCGYPPFNGSTNAKVHDAIRRGRLAFDEHVWGNLSKASRDFVGKLLCMDSKIGTAAEALRHPWVLSS